MSKRSSWPDRDTRVRRLRDVKLGSVLSGSEVPYDGVWFYVDFGDAKEELRRGDFETVDA